MQSLLALVLVGASASGGELVVGTTFPDRFRAHETQLFRIDSMNLRDPHLFASVEVFPGTELCLDVTDDNGDVPSFNGNLNQSLNNDTDGDGLLDASILMRFEPLGWPERPGNLLLAEGECTAPVESTQCQLADPGTGDWFESTPDKLCRAALPGTVQPYDPPVPSITGPCFATPPGDQTVVVDGVELTLDSASLGGDWTTIDQGGIDSGLLRGFLSEDDADAVIIPEEIEVIGGQPLSSLLPGGSGNCSDLDDRDTLDGVTGWWFYFEYAAESVPSAGN